MPLDNSPESGSGPGGREVTTYTPLGSSLADGSEVSSPFPASNSVASSGGGVLDSIGSFLGGAFGGVGYAIGGGDGGGFGGVASSVGKGAITGAKAAEDAVAGGLLPGWLLSEGKKTVDEVKLAVLIGGVALLWFLWHNRKAVIDTAGHAAKTAKKVAAA